MPVSEVSSADLFEILTPIWHRKAETARRVRLRLRAVLEWAVAMEYRIDFRLRPDRTGAWHPTKGCPAHAGLAESGGGCGYRDGAGIDGIGGRQAGLRVPGADGSQVGRGAAGRVGGDQPGRRCADAPWRFSRRRRHLGEAAGPLVFTGGQGKPLDDKQLRWLLREQGIAAVPHGFRSSFRDWAAEQTDAPHAVIEAALAHVVRNRVEAAYARSDLFGRRRILMDDWARYLARGTGGGPGALGVNRPVDSAGGVEAVYPVAPDGFAASAPQGFPTPPWTGTACPQSPSARRRFLIHPLTSSCFAFHRGVRRRQSIPETPVFHHRKVKASSDPLRLGSTAPGVDASL